MKENSDIKKIIFETYLTNGESGPFSLGCRESNSATVYTTVEPNTKHKVL